jgi:hypothetical protein
MSLSYLSLVRSHDARVNILKIYKLLPFIHITQVSSAQKLSLGNCRRPPTSTLRAISLKLAEPLYLTLRRHLPNCLIISQRNLLVDKYL